MKTWIVGIFKENLEERCSPCDVCSGVGYWTGYDGNNEIKTACEVCNGAKCLEINPAGVSIGGYDGECNGHCGLTRVYEPEEK